MKGLLVVGLFAFVLFQGAGAARAVAFSVPVSNNILEGYFEAPDGLIVPFEVQDGGMLMVQETGEQHYALVPVLKGAAGIEIIAFEIFQQTSGDEVVEIGRSYTSGGNSLILLPPGSFRFVVSSVRAADFEDGMLSVWSLQEAILFDQSNSGVCCITCGGATMCGSTVKTSCGACEAENQMF